MFGGDGQDHPLLRLGDPDLGVRQALVLERGAVEVDLGAKVLAHLADGRAEAPRAAVGDRAEQAPVAHLEDDVEDHLLGDRVADLDGAPGDGLALAGQLGRAERGAVDAVAAGPASDRDDPVARLDALARHPPRQDADRTAEDQGVGQVAAVDDQGAVDGWDAHPVAVVAHPRDDPAEHPLRVQHARGQVAGREVRGRDAEDVGVADRLGPQPGPHRVADHAPEARVGAAVGVDRRGVVVRLDLEADVVLVVEPDHPGVVGEDAHQPVEVQVARGLEDRLLEQVVDDLALELDPAAERLVRAVLAPGLRRVSSSQSVGSRPSPSKWSWMARISARLR